VRAVGLLAAAALGCTGAAAQVAGADVYKGRVKPGLYELKTETVMKDVEGVPKGQEKTTETRKHCFSEQEVAKGLEMRAECKPKVNKATSSSVEMVYDCNGLDNEFHLKPAGSGGFETRLVAREKPPGGGKPYTMTMTSQWKYLGACK
jgi:hypothetical protein